MATASDDDGPEPVGEAPQVDTGVLMTGMAMSYEEWGGDFSQRKNRMQIRHTARQPIDKQAARADLVTKTYASNAAWCRDQLRHMIVHFTDEPITPTTIMKRNAEAICNCAFLALHGAWGRRQWRAILDKMCEAALAAR